MTLKTLNRDPGRLVMVAGWHDAKYALGSAASVMVNFQVRMYHRIELMPMMKRQKG